MVTYELAVWRQLTELVQLVVDQLKHAVELLVKDGSNVVATGGQTR